MFQVVVSFSNLWSRPGKINVRRKTLLPFWMYPDRRSALLHVGLSTMVETHTRESLATPWLAVQYQNNSSHNQTSQQAPVLDGSTLSTSHQHQVRDKNFHARTWQDIPQTHSNTIIDLKNFKTKTSYKYLCFPEPSVADPTHVSVISISIAWERLLQYNVHHTLPGNGSCYHNAFFILLYVCVCLHACMYVNLEACTPQHICGGQKTTMGVCTCLHVV